MKSSPHNHVYTADKLRPVCVELVQFLLFGILQSLLCDTIVISFVPLKDNFCY